MNTNFNTVLIVLILIIIAVVGGAWWYKEYGQEPQQTSGLQINLGETQAQ